MKKRFLAAGVLLVLVWMAFIFSNSIRSRDSSLQQSGIPVLIVQYIFDQFRIEVHDISVLTLVRKIAHAFEYAVQAVLLCLVLCPLRLKLRSRVVNVLFIGLFTAVADEFVQLFSDGRGSEVTDILVDFCGVLAGVALVALVRLLIHARRPRRRAKW